MRVRQVSAFAATPVLVVQAGGIAYTALRAAGTCDAAPASLDGYQRINDELIWVGCGPQLMHPRIVSVDPCVRAPRETVSLDIAGAVVWYAPPSIRKASMSGKLWEALGASLLAGLSALNRGRGFGSLLLGGNVEFPLSSAVPQVVKLAQAYRANSPRQVLETSVPLLGAGPGLTPSGDDLVGAALFARALLPGYGAEWKAVSQALVEEAKIRTNPISAALFSDLAGGESFDALHWLTTTRDGAGDAAARRLIALGHSSGWDMLTGFAIGAGWPLEHLPQLH
jgi:hypothetical protein